MSHHIVKASDLHFKYPDGTIGLDGVSFLITHGESVALVGGNGAGKSTLLMHMTGCLFASSGSLQIGDLPVNAKTLTNIRKSVGMVFQDSDDQLFMPTVFEDVAFGPMNMGLARNEVEPLVLKALERVEALHLKDRPPFKLSAGEKRRAAIATVLAMSPDILVLDEPTVSLDPRSRRELIELLKSIKHTKIIATHDLDLALEVCGRTIVMHAGAVLADDTAQAVFQNENILSQARLEKPLSMQSCTQMLS